ncbi:hypothetical protein BH24ACI3_BH24ACI3_02350 [soil metagenome]
MEAIYRELPALFAAAFTAILFIQSGLDKVTDWKGNLGWLTGHFAETPLSKLVPALLGTITILELATGILAAIGIIYFLFAGSTLVIFYSAILGSGTLLALFFGQRMAKDYPGAAVLVPYFLVMVALLYLTRPV